jgi:hypothetical protein
MMHPPFLGTVPPGFSQSVCSDSVPIHGILLSLLSNIERSGADPTRPFFYLGGPMTGIPQLNFPRFGAVAAKLRKNGYNVVSPSELDNPEIVAQALASTDGEPGSGQVGEIEYNDFLGRDLVICSLSTCVGGIFLEGWHHSRGARGESWVLQFLSKDLFEYSEEGDEIILTKISHRDERMFELGVSPEGVPHDAPGIKTAASNGHKS